MTSPPSRSATASATAVLPDAVGPKIARTCPLVGGNLEVGLLRHPVPGEVGRMLRVLAEPGNGPWDPFLERDARLPAEQVACLPDVCDVMRHLAEQRRGEDGLRLHPQRSCDQLRCADDRVPLAV